MAHRRKGPPLFDLLSEGVETSSKPRYRSGLPTPVPTPVPDPTADPASDPKDDSSVALAEPAAEPTARPERELFRPEPVATPSVADEPEPPKPRRHKHLKHSRSSVESKPAPPPAPPPAEPETIAEMDRPESAVSMTTRIGDLKDSVFSGTNRLYLASGIAIIALVAGGTVLNAVLSSGGTQTQPDDLETLVSGPGSIDDPLRSVVATGGDGVGSGESGREPTNLIEMGAPPTPPAAQPTFIDSRVAGENYLLLAGGLSRTEATNAAQFLTENGVPAIPIGMESGTLEGNNHERFLLYSLFGVPGQRFSAMLQQRTDHEERIRTLGGIWLKEHGGTVNFHDPQWTKYQP